MRMVITIGLGLRTFEAERARGNTHTEWRKENAVGVMVQIGKLAIGGVAGWDII